MRGVGCQPRVSPAWQLQLPWGHPRSGNRCPSRGDGEMETMFSARLRSGVTCIAPALDDVPETMGCHIRKV